MTLPLSSTMEFSIAAGLGMALVLGFGFGYCLERAGFGSARKLVSQFYLNDLAVFKVMFTAIVTAMVGIYVLGTIGFLDRSQLTLVPTNLWPDIVGGLVLGAGFVIGGYCPGTSIVGAATGRIDALVYVLGVAAGTFAVGEAWPALKGFCESSDYGRLTLPQVLHLPEGVVVLLVVAMAIGGFVGAQWVERKFAAPQAGS